MKITSPDTTYTGQSRYGDTVLNFEKGVAVHDGDLPAGVRQYLNGAGYGLDGAPSVQDDAEKAHLSKALAGDVSADGPEGDPSEKWTVAQLKDYAEAREIDLGGAKKKADIVAAIVAASEPQGEPEEPEGETPEENPEGPEGETPEE